MQSRIKLTQRKTLGMMLGVCCVALMVWYVVRAEKDPHGDTRGAIPSGTNVTSTPPVPPPVPNGKTTDKGAHARAAAETPPRPDDSAALGELVGLVDTGNFAAAIAAADKMWTNAALSLAVRERAMAWKGRLLAATGRTNEAIAPAAGSRTILAMVDANGATAELSATDNTLSLQYTVLP